MSEHAHAVNAVVTGLSALPGTARPFAATRAMTRFLNHDDIPFHALIEPAQDAVRSALAERPGRFALVVHDWCMFNFNAHKSKRDRYVRSHGTDLGYELGTALAVDAVDGRPLGPMEFRLRTAEGMLGTRAGGAALPPGHVDELDDVMAAARRLGAGPHADPRHRPRGRLGRPLPPLAGRRPPVRRPRRPPARRPPRGPRVQAGRGGRRPGRLLHRRARRGGPARGGHDPGRDRAVRVAEAAVVLHRPARHNTGEKTAGGSKKQVEVPGPPLPLRMVVTQVVDEAGAVLAEWWLLTNVAAADADAATIGRWYALAVGDRVVS